MKAIVYTEYGPPEVLRLAELPQPTPKDNELLIKVHATTVTSGDCNMRGFTFVPRGFGLISRLMFGYRRPKKPILGVEFAGEVAAVGRNVTRFQVGDAVFGLDGAGISAYATYKCVAETAGLALKPSHISFAEAAAVPNGALTALTFLRKLGKLQAGQELLIVGASGSVGSAAVQIGRHLGAVVTGVCSTANVEMVKSLGAERVIDYTSEDFRENGRTYDIIFDTVAKTSFAACKNSLKPKGVYLAGAGGLPEFGQMAWTALTGGKKVIAGVSSESQEDLQFITELLATGAFRPVIDRMVPLEEIVAAHRYVDQGHKKGNVVIQVVQS